MDGKEFEGGSAKGENLLIGSGQFISGFEDGLIGHKKGEEVTLDLTFPQDYKATEMQGKAVQFKVKINSISEAPELTDEWVAENTQYKTVEEYKKKQKELMQNSADLDYESQINSDLFTLVVNDTKFEKYPEDMLETAKKKSENSLMPCIRHNRALRWTITSNNRIFLRRRGQGAYRPGAEIFAAESGGTGDFQCRGN